MVLTGATMPACEAVGLFRNIALHITRIRAGDRFTKVIEEFSKTFADQVGAARTSWRLFRPDAEDPDAEFTEAMKNFTEAQIGQLYSDITNRGNGPFSGGINGNVRRSWSCNGWTFELKPPCLRCQYL